jgi:predicted GIY-YIG superfamily endonuclease
MNEGWVYMLHFLWRYVHAGHYTGWTYNLERRMKAHATGYAGSRLMEVVVAQGIPWVLACYQPGVRSDERRLKRWGGAAKRCPICRTLAGLPMLKAGSPGSGERWDGPGRYPGDHSVQQSVDVYLASQLDGWPISCERTASVQIPRRGPEPLVAVELNWPACGSLLRNTPQDDNVMSLAFPTATHSLR